MNKEKVKPLLLKIFEILSMVFITIYPPLYMYFNNVGEAKLKDIIPVSFFFLSIILIIYFITYLITKRNSTKSVFVVNIFIIIAMNYKKIEDIIIPLNEYIYYWHIVLLVIFVISILIYFLNHTNFKELKNINILLGTTYLILLCIVIFSAIPKYLNLDRENNTQVKENIKVRSSDNKDKPNFYYFIFDEYPGYKNSKILLNYEDQLYDYISDLKVNVSKTSYNKDWLTARVIPDLYNLEYITYPTMLPKDIGQMFKNPTLYQVCRNSGYKLNILSEWNLMDRENVDYAFSGITSGDESIFSLVMGRSIFYPLLGLQSINNNVADVKIRLLKEFHESYKLGQNGMCNIAYTSLPHAPHLFREDGTINHISKYYQRDADAFVPQLKYISKQISSILHEIITNDPNAVILIQSDHGSRLDWYKFTRFGSSEPGKDVYKLMTNHLNILYYKGEKVDIEGQSGYQTLNETVRKVFGYEDGYKNGYITSIDESYENRDKTVFR